MASERDTVRPEVARDRLLQAALRCLSARLAEESAYAAAEAEYANDELALAARDLVTATNALPTDRKPHEREVVGMTGNPFPEPFAAAILRALDGGAPPPIPVGRTVVCDCCSEDMTNSPRSGGFAFEGFGGTWAAGPCCAGAEEARMRAQGAGDLITGHCPAGMPFADWVRALRGADAAIRVKRRFPGGDAR
jgi:hypothetical protein